MQKSIGQVSIRIPVDAYSNFLECKTDIINCGIPILQGLVKITDLHWYVNEVTNEFWLHDNSNLKDTMKYRKGLLYLKWPFPVAILTRRK